ncbi:MAG TPA: hypothetical protein PKM65_05270 [Spirochaetota bacterium]|nr:hypothetical protein [Spirochaetota bacterium]HNV48083.1 hypothetical protein [Spirochaetota bacterium]HPU88345.1 hypothetical protein [Spirochaetota bacterium]
MMDTNIGNVAGRKAFVRLQFGPNWNYIATVRIFVMNFLAITLEDKKKADVIAMAVNEMVENAIKYSNQACIEIHLDVFEGDKTITVMVGNHATRESYESFTEILDEISARPPLEAFLERMRVSSSGPDRKSMIGLARIRYESGAKLSHTFEDGYLRVYASFDS